MDDRPELRSLRLLMRDGSGRSLLLDNLGGLPEFTVELGEKETTVLAR